MAWAVARREPALIEEVGVGSEGMDAAPKARCRHPVLPGLCFDEFVEAPLAADAARWCEWRHVLVSERESIRSPNSNGDRMKQGYWVRFGQRAQTKNVIGSLKMGDKRGTRSATQGSRRPCPQNGSPKGGELD
ncbi:MAG: hypothetical protein AAFU85_04725 [Planctomycetota bacterium]